MCVYLLNLYIVVLEPGSFLLSLSFNVLHFPHYLEKINHCFKNYQETRIVTRQGGATWHLISFCQVLIFTLAGEKENLSILLCVLRISVLV